MSRCGRIGRSGIALDSGGSELARRISVVAAVVPFADIERLACRDDISLRAERHGAAIRGDPTDATGGRSLARGCASGRRGPLGPPRPLARAGPDDLDAVRCLSTWTRARPAAKSVVSLPNDDNERFPSLFRDLPTGITRRRSCLGRACSCGARSGGGDRASDDPYFPLPEAEAVVELVPEARLTVTRVLDHTRPSLALSHIGDFARFLGWVRRCLRAASA
jgi:hypothetical protein